MHSLSKHSYIRRQDALNRLLFRILRLKDRDFLSEIYATQTESYDTKVPKHIFEPDVLCLSVPRISYPPPGKTSIDGLGRSLITVS